MRYFIIFLMIVAAFWLGIYAVEHSSDVTIKYQWNNNPMSVSLTSTTLLIIGIVGIIGLYVFFTILKFLLGLRKMLKARKLAKLTSKANQELTQGLVHFTEGNWKDSEKTLLNNVKHSDTPLLNYLAAARAAHMQEAYERRDSYLKTASEFGQEGQIAILASQADMQYASGQLEQARATLIHLLEAAPKHPYAIKLLAKVYFHQEDWGNLFTLLSDLDQLSLINTKDYEKYQATALTGIFHDLAHKKDIANLHLLWKKLPANAKNNPKIALLYFKALNDAEDSTCEKLLVNYLNNNWDEQLAEFYGLLDHANIGNAIKQSEKWLPDHENSPKLLLTLARLNRRHQLWGKSKAFYNSSLNFSPSTPVYLEVAELLEELGEHENAQICYKTGLNYSIHKKGKILNLKAVKRNDASLKIVPDAPDDLYSI